jgi:hypothetical protein
MIGSAAGYLNLFPACERKFELAALNFIDRLNMTQIYDILAAGTEKALVGQAGFKVVKRAVNQKGTTGKIGFAVISTRLKVTYISQINQPALIPVVQ